MIRLYYFFAGFAVAIGSWLYEHAIEPVHTFIAEHARVIVGWLQLLAALLIAIPTGLAEQYVPFGCAILLMLFGQLQLAWARKEERTRIAESHEHSLRDLMDAATRWVEENTPDSNIDEGISVFKGFGACVPTRLEMELGSATAAMAVVTHFARAERSLARVWSAQTDHHVDEARSAWDEMVASLAEAQSALHDLLDEPATA